LSVGPKRDFSLAAIILSMTAPTRSSKLLLVADPRPDSDAPPTAAVRRYRLARLRFDSRPAGPHARFEHLKRVYD
jgi:hypothetical protein